MLFAIDSIFESPAFWTGLASVLGVILTAGGATAGALLARWWSKKRDDESFVVKNLQDMLLVERQYNAQQREIIQKERDRAEAQTTRADKLDALLAVIKPKYEELMKDKVKTEVKLSEAQGGECQI